MSEEILTTMDARGKRRWLHPRLSRGRFWYRRRTVAWALISVFVLLPMMTINGKPAVLLDLPQRQFTVFGFTFLPTDTLLLTLFVVGLGVTVFLLTALWGRIWCGWGCPQTVYLEFVYRPLDRLFARLPGPEPLRLGIKHLLFFLISVFLAHVFLSYFVPWDSLSLWMHQSPLSHPLPFLVIAVTTVLMLFDFCYFREQLCILACPYGRFQSVLLDRYSLIVGYDARRGEPRERSRQKRRAAASTAPSVGHCVDCGLCVKTCPTGIDIRQGLQLECIGCAQCIDACDRVMAANGQPPGLIRYSSQAALDGQPPRLLRPRVVIYPLILTAIVALLIGVFAGKGQADVTVMRNFGNPFVVLDDGAISNSLRVKINNRSGTAKAYHLAVADAGVQLIADRNPIAVAPGVPQTEGIVLVAARDAFSNGVLQIELAITSDGFDRRVTCRLLGP